MPIQDWRKLESLTDLTDQLKQAEREREQAHGRRNLAHALDRMIVRIKRRIKQMGS